MGLPRGLDAEDGAAPPSQDGAEPGRERLALLAEAGALLGEGHDDALARLPALLVPRLADFCSLDLVAGDVLARVACAHRDPDKAWVLRELGRSRVRAAGEPALPPARVAQSGQPALFPELPEPALQAMAADGREAALLRELAPTSVLAVPIRMRGEVAGVLTLGMSGSDRRHAPGDLAMAEELARRAASQLEIALLRAEAERQRVQRRRAEAERERLLFELKEAVAARDAFLSIASHELKTPLTALQLAVQSAGRAVHQLGGSETAVLAGTRLATAERQVKRLTSLVDQLLDISRIQLGRLELDVREVDLCQLVREVTDRFESELARQGCALELRLPGQARGRWDPSRLDQVLTNLISNALKYGAGKPVRVSVELCGERARVVVADGGIGIAEEHQQRIFERFERAVSPRHYSGFGLGLWIVRQILDALGGAIRVQSAPGAGSVFEVDLPLRPPGSAAVSAA